MTVESKVTDWEVRVYAADSDVDPIQKWIVTFCTEAEAMSEAAADIENEFPGCEWTLEEVPA